MIFDQQAMAYWDMGIKNSSVAALTSIGPFSGAQVFIPEQRRDLFRAVRSDQLQ